MNLGFAGMAGRAAVAAGYVPADHATEVKARAGLPTANGVAIAS
jgi:hypothetical protein